ncbi:sugar ABC transporter permease [Kaistia dalseonensis]|uniref:Multiple sugar transport system permease protein n=2 Tax=Kaistia dalseonensis TaxID=410840 RepID=A0ABU0HCZ2_9HYPH|nr:sugar ABC transporter permease [Kaistia dalseonensis]MCX5496738.1 sugar ABC transporter permease [Kaistia dalseonensis]MDQ0439364.1 multiple sugar transport system permease protein [Kaistia dalseonensis]
MAMSEAALARRNEGGSRSSIWRRLEENPFSWLLPVAILLGIFYLYPIFDVLRLAFTNASLRGGEEHYTFNSFVALIANPVLPDILWTTFIFTAGSVLGQQLFGLGIAVLVMRGERRRLYGMTALRTIVLIAWVIPGIANGLIWQMLFSEAPFGAMNSVLRMLHIAPVAWLSDPGIAMISAIISNVWRGTAFSMIVLYAALKVIDVTLYEAASVDGASGWQKFRYITLPQLRPAILVNSILITIATLNTFDAIISLTGGGPGRATEVLSLYTFNTVFRNLDLAGGSVLSLLMLLISLVLAVGYASFLPRREPNE